jgi:hypothetical protein
MSKARAVCLGLVVSGLASCASGPPRHPDLSLSERHAAVCYAAPPAVLLAAITEVLRTRSYEVTRRSEPAGWLSAARGDSRIWIKLDTEATCSRIDITGWAPADPHASRPSSDAWARAHFYPLIRRRLARVADAPVHALPGR